jgi:hypothetical protein
MFKALNPYQFLAVKGTPADRIELGRTPELSRCRWLAGGQPEWLTWKAFCQQIIPVRSKPGQTNSNEEMPVGKFLLHHAERLRAELDSSTTLAWDPADQLRAWLSPYLTVTTLDDVKALLDQDIALLRETIQSEQKRSTTNH